jgi:hypothetical protein
MKQTIIINSDSVNKRKDSFIFQLTMLKYTVREIEKASNDLKKIQSQ